MTAYTCLIDLTIGDTTPGFVMSWPGGGTLPANAMPILEIGDSVTFVFSGRGVTACLLYARPLTASEKMSPFATFDKGEPPANGIIDVIANKTIHVVFLNGHWGFALCGLYAATNTFGHDAFAVPFFVDPEADVGTGVPP